MVKHTPGPWEIEDRCESDFIDIEPMVCRIERGNPAAEANARLIASAPEMLEALQALFVDYAESEGCYCGQIVGGTKDGYPMHICGYCIAEKVIIKAGGTFIPKAEGALPESVLDARECL